MELIDNFRLEEPQEIPAQRFPRIRKVPENAFTVQLKVAWQDLDILDIVNNAVYVAYAEEAAAQMFGTFGWSPAEQQRHGLAMVVHRLHIQYQMPAVWGDTLEASIFTLELDRTGGALYVDMARASDGAAIASCTLDWSLIHRDSGEARGLPESLANALVESLLR